MIAFECLECGECCRNLLKKSENGLYGLNLIPKERKLFERKVVCPHTAIGRKYHEKIILYQLTSDVCPYISNSNKCKIYNKRPLSCRAFPIVSVGELPKIESKDCTFMRQTGVNNEKITISIGEGKKAIIETNDYVKKVMFDTSKEYKTKLNVWMWDLETKEWKKIE